MGMTTAEPSTTSAMVAIRPTGEPVKRSISDGGEVSPECVPRKGYFMASVRNEVGSLNRNAVAVTRPAVEIKTKSEGRDTRD